PFIRFGEDIVENQAEPSIVEGAKAYRQSLSCALCAPIAHDVDLRSSLPNGPALSCRPPLSVPRNDRRPPGDSTPAQGGRRAGKPGKSSGGGRAAAAPC